MVDMARNHSKNTYYYETIVSYSISGLKVQNWVQNLSPNSLFLGITGSKTNKLNFLSICKTQIWMETNQETQDNTLPKILGHLGRIWAKIWAQNPILRITGHKNRST